MCDHKRKRYSHNVTARLEMRPADDNLNANVLHVYVVSPGSNEVLRYSELVECYDCDVVISATRAMEE